MSIRRLVPARPPRSVARVAVVGRSLDHTPLLQRPQVVAHRARTESGQRGQLRRRPRTLLAVQHLDHALAGVVGQRPDGARVGDGDLALRTEESFGAFSRLPAGRGRLALVVGHQLSVASAVADVKQMFDTSHSEAYASDIRSTCFRWRRQVFPFHIAPGLSAATEPVLDTRCPRHSALSSLGRATPAADRGPSGARPPRRRHRSAGSAAEFALPHRRRVRLPGCPDGLRPSFSSS